MKLFISAICLLSLVLVSAQSAAELYENSISLGKDGEYKIAIKKLARAIQLDSTETKYYNTLGLFILLRVTFGWKERERTLRYKEMKKKVFRSPQSHSKRTLSLPLSLLDAYPHRTF